MALTYTCNLSQGYPVPCRNSSGGIQEVWIGTWNGASTTITTGTASFETGAGTEIISVTGSGLFYPFPQPLETGEFSQSGGFSTENGTSMYTQTLNITIQQYNGFSWGQINILGQGVWRILVLDQNGNYFYLGSQNGCRVTAATPGAGKSMNDLNGAIITFEGKEPVPAYQISANAAIQLMSGT